LKEAGKEKMVIRIALARKLLVILNAKARDARAEFANPFREWWSGAARRRVKGWRWSGSGEIELTLLPALVVGAVVGGGG
jgi:hypothetical protein